MYCVLRVAVCVLLVVFRVLGETLRLALIRSSMLHLEENLKQFRLAEDRLQADVTNAFERLAEAKRKFELAWKGDSDPHDTSESSLAVSKPAFCHFAFRMFACLAFLQFACLR